MNIWNLFLHVVFEIFCSALRKQNEKGFFARKIKDRWILCLMCLCVKDLNSFKHRIISMFTLIIVEYWPYCFNICSLLKLWHVLIAQKSSTIAFYFTITEIFGPRHDKNKYGTYFIWYDWTCNESFVSFYLTFLSL
jgi:hypothetical protein